MAGPDIQPKRRGPTGLAIAAAFALGCVAPATATSSPTASVIQNTGDKANRVDILFVGDGYTAEEMPIYAFHVGSVLEHMFDTGGLNTGITNPYARYVNFFNIIRVDIESNESGVDRYGPNDQVIELVDTALKGRLGATRQGVYYPQSLTIDSFFAAPPLINSAAGPLGYSHSFNNSDFDWQFAAVNTTEYGGEASTFATFTAGNVNAAELALHEGGHWNHDLADEYGGSATPFPFSAPEVNLDLDASGDDWAHWLGFNDPQTGVVGAFEGGRGYDTGVYHPSADTKMRSLDRAFDPIAREKIILDIYALIDPIDSHVNTGPSYEIEDELWIDVIDTGVINIQWLLNGEVIDGLNGETLDLGRVVSALGPGEHTLTARAYDTILDHSFSDNNTPDPLDLVRRDLDQLEQSVDFSIDIDWLPGDTDFDGDIDQDDLTTVIQAFGTTTTVGNAAAGDLDGDGSVGIYDLDLVLARWSSETPPSLVPEPAAALLLITLPLLTHRRNRSRA